MTLTKPDLTLKRLTYSLIFATAFSVIGYLVPQTYLKYFDNTEYIKYVGLVTFDKKEYSACENQTAQTTFKILIDTPITIKARLYLQRVGDNESEVIKEFTFNSFLAKQSEPQIHVSTFPLPCDLKPGVYFYRGILTYTIKGVEKTTSYASEQFTITKGVSK